MYETWDTAMTTATGAAVRPAAIPAAVRATAAMFFLNGALFGGWASRVPAVRDRFALDEGTLGLLLLALAAGAVTSFPLAGAAVDRLGAARVTRRCAVLYVLLMPLLGLAPALPLLALVIFLFGAAHGAMDVAMNAWGAEVEQARGGRRSLMPMLHGLFSIGAGCGAAAGALFAGLAIGAAPHFLAFALLCGLPTLLIARIDWPSPVLPATANRAARPLIAIPRRGLLAAALVAFAAALGEGAMADWSAVYLVDTFRAPPAQAAIGYALFSLTMVAVRLTGGRTIGRFGPVPTIRACGLLAAAGAALLMLAPSVWLAWLAMAALGAGYALVMPLVFSRAAADPRLSPGAAMAAVSTFSYGGMLLGPPLIGFIAQVTTLRSAMLLLLVLALLIVWLAPSLRRPVAAVS